MRQYHITALHNNTSQKINTEIDTRTLLRKLLHHFVWTIPRGLWHTVKCRYEQSFRDYLSSKKFRIV